MPVSGNYNFQNHLNFLGLSHNPFPVAPDNTDFYLSQHNDIVIEKLTQAILTRKGFMLLTGEIGLGKTTLSREIIQTLELHQVETSLILQSFFQETNLLKEIVKDFGIQTEETKNDLPLLMTRLNEFLLKKNKAGINCAIVIDDAQNLTIESLELIRMISNLEADTEKLVQILLVGQPELLEKLNCKELRQLKSRVTIRQKPIPLKHSEMGTYIHFKLNKAGNIGKIIVKDNTIEKLYQKTLGNLRKTNILMDQALNYAVEEKTFTIKPGFITRADKELTFDVPTRKARNFLSSFIIFLLVLVIIGMGGGITFFYVHSARKAPSVARKIVVAPEEKVKPAILPDTKIKIQGKPILIENETVVTDSVTSFLSAYGLDSFSTQFQQALNQKKLSDIKDLIFDQTGYQLITLNTIPPFVREKFDVLSSVDPDTQKTECYLFWKPWLKIIKFYSGYRGEEISDLQTLLLKINLYHYNIDGIVGQIIMKSVKEFQRNSNLPVTGFPDPETIFLMANTDKK